MTNAIVGQLNGTITDRASLGTAIKAALQSVGFTALADGTNRINLYKQITANAVAFQNLFFSIDVGTNIGACLTSGSGNATIANNVNVQGISGGYLIAGAYTIYTVAHPEVCGITLYGSLNNNVDNTGSPSATNAYAYQLMYWRPSVVPSYWNEDNFLFGFISNSLNFANVSNGASTTSEHKFIPATSLMPSSASGTLALNYGASILDANPANNTRTILTAPSIVNSSSNGLVATFSSDIACVAANGLAIGAKVKKATGEIYTIIEPQYSYNPKMRMAVRTG